MKATRERSNYRLPADVLKAAARRAKTDKVTVTDVRTMVVRAKRRTLGRHVGRRPSWKKAIVTLKEGDAIEVFEG